MFNVSVPVHLVPFLLHGERDGITEEEANEATIFKEKFSAFLPLPFEKVFTPSENQPTQFCPGFNDVTAEDAQCYIFAVPHRRGGETMIYRITQALKAEKYHLPKVGTYTGAQLAAMLQQQKAPAETVRVFQNFVESVKIDPPRHIIIAPPAQ